MVLSWLIPRVIIKYIYNFHAGTYKVNTVFNCYLQRKKFTSFHGLTACSFCRLLHINYQIEIYKICSVGEAMEIEKSWKLNKSDDSLNISTLWKTIMKKQHEENSPSLNIKTNTGLQYREHEKSLPNHYPAPSNEESARFDLHELHRINTSH